MPKSCCPKCGQNIQVPDTSAELKFRCRVCNHIFLYKPDQESSSKSKKSLFAQPELLIVGGVGIAIFAILFAWILTVVGTHSDSQPVQVTLSPETTVESQEDTGNDGSEPIRQVRSVSSTQLSPEQLFAKVSPAVVRVVVQDKDFQDIGQGSGVILSSDGLIVTNAHVIEDANFARVVLNNNFTLFVDGIAAIDEDNDLALLKVNANGLSEATLAGEDLPNIGAKVYAIGNPKGLTNTFSEGIVSAIRGDMGSRIQTTAPISPGSSGGPLLGSDGKVIGVTTSFLKGGQNLNFAVSVNLVRQLLADRKNLVPLASAGLTSLDSQGTDKLDEVWRAINENNFREALGLLAAFPADMRNAFYWFATGYVHDGLGNYDLAVSACQTAIAIKPDFANAYNNMGNALGKLNRNAEAVSAYQAAIAIKPDYANAYYNMGIALTDMNRNAEAVSACQTAIAIKPDFANAYQGMGVALRKMNRDAEADAAFETAKRLGY